VKLAGATDEDKRSGLGIVRQDSERLPFLLVRASHIKTKGRQSHVVAVWRDARPDDPEGVLDPLRCWTELESEAHGGTFFGVMYTGRGKHTTGTANWARATGPRDAGPP